MKKIFTFMVIIIFMCGNIAFAKDVHVKGYYRKNGTYVRPHIRSSPDRYKWNNYGPSKNSTQLMNPKLRDNDRDGIPNYQDSDDDNDGIKDDNDFNQYNKKTNLWK